MATRILISRLFGSTKFLEGSELKYAFLKNRALMRLTGPDTLGFLQGLITNDTQYLARASSQYQGSLYSLMLNTQGRVTHDLIIHNCTDRESRDIDVIIECDKTNYEDLADTFLKYRMRKKVDFLRVSDSLTVIAVFPGCHSAELLKKDIQNLRLVSARLPEMRWHSQIVSWTLDPRVSRLGGRMILPIGEDPEPYLVEPRQATEEEYDSTRYALGIAEGIGDILPEKGLPLECNGDYMNGISFHKGCYIGQELTARTHHTGVVRKRLMPLKFNQFHRNELARAKPDAKIQNELGELVGRFRSSSGLFGLGLLRIDQVDKSKQLKLEIEGTTTIDVETYFPFWWGSTGTPGEIRGFHTKETVAERI